MMDCGSEFPTQAGCVKQPAMDLQEFLHELECPPELVSPIEHGTRWQAADLIAIIQWLGSIFVEGNQDEDWLVQQVTESFLHTIECKL